jgi:hypothetical protein
MQIDDLARWAQRCRGRPSDLSPGGSLVAIAQANTGSVEPIKAFAPGCEPSAFEDERSDPRDVRVRDEAGRS